MTKETLKVFRGDSLDSIKLTLKKGPRIAQHGHVDRKCFCTTLSFGIAQLFALRRSPPAILQGNFEGAGQIIEYKLTGKENKDWQKVQDHRALQQEAEVVVFKASCLKPVAIWQCQNDEWTRKKVA